MKKIYNPPKFNIEKNSNNVNALDVSCGTTCAAIAVAGVGTIAGAVYTKVCSW